MQQAPPGNVQSRIPPGTQLNGIYEIDYAIASGGMGEVYKGHAIQTGDAVAIKMMLPDLAEDESALALFRKEAAALHHLYHEAIVRYFVFTIEPTLQCPYLAMEFVEGHSLSDLLRHGPLSLEAVRPLLLRVASGLQAAHERGIIHRDVSPDNIIIPAGEMSRAKIIDFGIARSTALGEGTIIGGGFAGKYNYVSPEQLGLFGGDVTAKSDIYSLGLVIAEALTGKPLDMGGSQADVVDKRRKVPDLGGIDERIQPLLEWMLQPEPADRIDSMAAVAGAALEAPAAGAKRKKTPQPVRDREGKKARPAAAPRPGGGKRLALAGAVAFLALGGGALAYYLLQPPAGPTGPPPPSLEGVGRPELGPVVTAPAPTVPSGLATRPEPGPASTGVGRSADVERFINRYEGGDCFFITPLAVSDATATITGYGVSLTPFQVLDDAFRRANGFEADIRVWQVPEQQCPAVTFLSRLRSQRTKTPRLEIASESVRAGQFLSGHIVDHVDRPVALLLVDEAGSVQNVSTHLPARKPARSCPGGPCPSPEEEEIAFTLQMSSGPAAAARPYLLIALASPEPLAALRVGQMPADRLFPLVLAEAASRGQTLSVVAKHFVVQR